MQTSNLESKPHECPLAEPVLKRVSLTQIVDHFHHVAHAGAGKGVI
jgi:hypothetical protein